MTLQGFIIVFVSVSLSAVAQMSFKHGVTQVHVNPDMHVVYKAWLFLTSPFVFIGLALYGVGTVLWLFALKQMDLSLAYPFVGMSFIMVFAFGVMFLGEPFNVSRLVGTIIIAVGILFLAKS